MKLFFVVSFVLTAQIQAFAATGSKCVDRSFFNSLEELIAECGQVPGVVTQYHYTGGDYENSDLDKMYEFSTYYFREGSRSCFTGEASKIPLRYYPDYPIEYNTMPWEKNPYSELKYVVLADGPGTSNFATFNFVTERRRLKREATIEKTETKTNFIEVVTHTKTIEKNPYERTVKPSTLKRCGF